MITRIGLVGKMGTLRDLWRIALGFGYYDAYTILNWWMFRLYPSDL